MLDFLLSYAALDAVYLPAALAAALVAWAPTRQRPHPVGIALSAGVLLGYLLTRPLPILPPIGAIGWLPFALLAGLAAGLAADLPRYRLAAGIAAVLILPVAIVAAVAAEQLNPLMAPPAWFLLMVITLAGIIAMTRLGEEGERFSAAGALVIAGAALSVVAWIYGSRIGQHAMSLTAAASGAAIAAYRFGLVWPRSASYAGGAAYLTVAATLFLSRGILALPVGLTMLAFFVRPAARTLAGGRRGLRRALEVAFGLGVIAAAALAANLG